MHKSQRGFLPWILLMGLVGSVISSSAAEYEVSGTITQTINYRKGGGYQKDYVKQTTNEFTVYVRDCAWLIQTEENDGKRRSWRREVGSTNGTEIYEFNGSQAFIYDTGIPVDLGYEQVDGHLWLMFASQCYWGSQHTDQLTPVFDFEASVGANPNLKVPAEWELLSGPGSLPREVRYLGEWGETNGLYTVTGTNSIGGMLIPSGFVFEERVVGVLSATTLVHELVVRKRVEAEVTSVQAVCSRQNLMPVWGNGKIITIDWRLKKTGSGNNVPSYFTPASEKWPSIEAADKLVNAQHPHHNLDSGQPAIQNAVEGTGQHRHLDSVPKHPAHHAKTVFIVTCIFLAGTTTIYFVLRRPWKK